MKSYRTLAWKELKTQKITSILILIAIVLSTLMTTVIGQSVGALNAMRVQQAASLSGKQYATFLQLTSEQIQSIKTDERFSIAGEYMSIGTAELNQSLSLSLVEPSKEYLDMSPTLSKLKEGRLPEQANEIALPEDALQYLGIEGTIGDTITLNLAKVLRQGNVLPFECTADFVLTGILESNYLSYSSSAVTGIVGAGTGTSLLPETYQFYNMAFQTGNPDDFQNVVNEYAEKFSIPDINIAYNSTYLNARGISYDVSDTDSASDSGFSFMTVVGVMVGALVLIAAGLVIYNILKISVSQRVQEYGTLRAIGGEKKQLYALVAIQLFILCGIGIPLGMIVGTLSTKGIITMATSALSPETFMVQNVEELQSLIAANSGANVGMLIVSAVITLVFAFLAAMPAAKYAAKVSPTMAMSGQSVKMKRRSRKEKKIRSFEAFYARLNLRRNMGRSIITILSLVMSITVFIALQGFASLLNVASTIEQSYMGDYALTSETVGFTSDALQQLEEHPDVKSVSAVSLKKYYPDENGHINSEEIKLGFDLKPGETFQLAGLNDNYLADFVQDTLSEQQMNALKNGTGCIVRNPLPMSYDGQTLPATTFQTGDTISIAGKELTVIDTLDGYESNISIGNAGFENGVQVIVTDAVYADLTNDTTYNEMYPTLKENVDREAFDNFVESLCAENPGSYSISYENADKQMAESFAQTQMLAWGLILFVGLIGILNIINTVYTNIHTRVNEIGMQRAIGMSVSSLYKTFLWEGVYYGLIASGIGAVAGYICTIFVEAAQTGSLGIVSIPLIPILEAAVISVLACLIATCVPLWQISKMEIVRAIENVE